MIRHANERTLDHNTHMREGKGTVLVDHLINPEEFGGKGRLFAVNTLAPGCSIGYHQHTGDFEVYHIVSGQGVYNDNGNEVQVKAGDVCIALDGEYHGIENTGQQDLVLTALIIFTNK